MQTARSGKTSPEEISHGTITTIGARAVDAGTPILNPGEAAILASGAKLVAGHSRQVKGL